MNRTLRCFNRALGTRPLCFIHWTKRAFRAVSSVYGVPQHGMDPLGDVLGMGFQGEVAGIQ